MRILCVCEEGNNRSVTLAQRLRYHNHETIAVGINRHSATTIDMLVRWADLVITVDRPVHIYVLQHHQIAKQVELWNIGPDKYPRPFNKELMRICDDLIKKFHQTPNQGSSKHATDRRTTGSFGPVPDPAELFGGIDHSREGTGELSEPDNASAAGGDASRAASDGSPHPGGRAPSSGDTPAA